MLGALTIYEPGILLVSHRSHLVYYGILHYTKSETADISSVLDNAEDSFQSSLSHSVNEHRRNPGRVQSKTFIREVKNFTKVALQITPQIYIDLTSIVQTMGILDRS